ncbi:MAG: hypothetical protein EHM58_00510 [Ignavibacteriae bacterium]|nr:MAG: hypothetical protein EHM58_00510 [Ignavibacteriota bacterium]
MLTINEYFKPFDDAIAQLNDVLFKTYYQVTSMDENDVVLNDFDYNSLIKGIEDLILILKMKRDRYKFLKMNLEEFDMYLRQDYNGNLIIAKDHQIRQYDTLQIISKQYDVSIPVILNYNNMLKQEFEDIKELGGSIKIPLKIKRKERTVFENLSVFDSHSGKSAWGRDISNSLAVENDRLKVLDYDNTLKQNLGNLLGEYGSIPFFEELTLNADWGSDYPKDFLELYTRIKIERRFELDPRVQKVIDVQSRRVDSGLTFDVKLYPVNMIIQPENEMSLLAG